MSEDVCPFVGAASVTSASRSEKLILLHKLEKRRLQVSDTKLIYLGHILMRALRLRYCFPAEVQLVLGDPRVLVAAVAVPLALSLVVNLIKLVRRTLSLDMVLTFI